MTDETLTTAVRRVGYDVVVTLAGEMDQAVEYAVGEAIREAVEFEGVRALHLNLTAIRFIDSSGIRALLVARRIVLDRGLAFTLEASHDGRVLQLLEQCGLTELFTD